MSANNETVKRWAKTHPEKHRAMVTRWEQENPEKRRAIAIKSQAKRILRLKRDAIEILGDVCVQCQCNDIRCLQIDHVVPLHGTQRLASVALYRSVIRGEGSNLQLLCANCHAIKTFNEAYSIK